MKHLIFTLLLTPSIISTVASAQALNFQGVDVQVGLGYQSTTGTGKITDPTDGVGTISTASSGSVATTLGISYTAAVQKQFTLGAIFESNPLKLKAGSTNTNPPTTYTVSTYDETFKNVFSLSLVPGYAIDNAHLVYAKLGYTNASAIFTSNDASANSSGYLNGYNLGLGMRIDTGNFYPFAELNYIKFISTTNLINNLTLGAMTQGGSAYNLVGGLGYHF